jgi:ribonuclease HI
MNPVQDQLRHIQLFTDGACSGNPGPGGWAFILRDVMTRKEKEGSGGASTTTNNQMEMTAVIEGLRSLKRPCRVDLYSDSKYVLEGLKTWMPGWKRNGWKKKSAGGGGAIKNLELWKELDQLIAIHRLSYHHVMGHSGHPENERCDLLAVAASQRY